MEEHVTTIQLDEAIPNQTASAVLDLRGNRVEGSLHEEEASILFAMIQETGQIQQDDGDSIQRITVSFANTRYVVARDNFFVYISQIKLV